MPIPTITPEAVRRLIARVGAPQRDFAAMLGVPPSTVTRWLAGRTRPNGASAAKLQRLASDFAALDLLDMETEAAMAWDGQTHVLRAMDAAEKAGLSLATTYGLLPSALRAKDEGMTAAQWALTIHEGGTGRALERAIPEMQGAGLWPWETSD